MKLSERITLIKAGYSKDEIDQIIVDQNAEPAQDPAPEQNQPEPAADYMKVLQVLADEVKGLKASVQAANIKNSDIDTGANAPSAESILASLFEEPGKGK